jgi:hypothetical protein
MHRDFLLKNSYNAKDDLTDKQYHTLRASGSLGRFSMPLTPFGSNKISEKFMQSYSKTLLNSSGQAEKKYSEDAGASFILAKGSFDKIDIDKDEGEEKEETEFIKQKIDAEIKNILDNRRNFVLNTLILENFSFDVISEKENLLLPNKNKTKAMNVKVIDDLLNKVQVRREKIIAQKKLMQVKLEKIGIKIC